MRSIFVPALATAVAHKVSTWQNNADGTQIIQPITLNSSVGLSALAWIISLLLGFITLGLIGGVIALVVLVVVQNLASNTGGIVEYPRPAGLYSAGIGGSLEGARPKPALAEGAQALIELLERIGVDFSLKDVRGALEDILRLGSANIPDLWLSDEEMLEKGLVEGQAASCLFCSTPPRVAC